MKQGTRVLKRRTFHPHFCQTAKKNLQKIFSSKVGAFALRSSLSIIGHARPYHWCKVVDVFQCYIHIQKTLSNFSRNHWRFQEEGSIWTWFCLKSDCFKLKRTFCRYAIVKLFKKAYFVLVESSFFWSCSNEFIFV